MKIKFNEDINLKKSQIEIKLETTDSVSEIEKNKQWKTSLIEWINGRKAIENWRQSRRFWLLKESLNLNKQTK